MAVVPVSPPATREPSALSTKSRCGTITARYVGDGLAIRCHRPRERERPTTADQSGRLILPGCPTGAIAHSPSGRPLLTMSRLCWKTSRKKQRLHRQLLPSPQPRAFHGCPGSRMHQFHREEAAGRGITGKSALIAGPVALPDQAGMPVNAPLLCRGQVLVAADCTAYHLANVHQEFMRGKVTLIGCPKRGDVDYSRSSGILRQNDIKSVTVLRMEAPCR